MRFLALSDRAERAARFCAIAIGFSIPVSVALDNLLLAMILLLWLGSASYRAKVVAIRENRIALAALALFAVLAAGLAWGGNDPGDGIDMLGKYVDLAFLPIFATLFGAEDTRRRAWLAFASAMTLTLVLSYLMWVGVLHDEVLVIGEGLDPVPFKQYLTQSILMAFSAFLFAQFALHATSPHSKVAWSMLAVLACANVTLMIDGRTGQVLLAVLAAYLTLSVWRWRGALAGIVLIGVVVVMMSVMPSSAQRIHQALEEWRNWQPTQAAQTSIGLRLEFYRNSLAIVRDHPLIGVGTGGFANAYAKQVAGSKQTPTVNPHNEYLNIAVQVGVLGLAALLCLFYYEWRLARELPSNFDFHMGRGLVLTIALGCLFNTLLMDHTEGLFFAWAGGLIYAGLKQTRDAGAPVQ